MKPIIKYILPFIICTFVFISCNKDDKPLCSDIIKQIEDKEESISSVYSMYSHHIIVYEAYKKKEREFLEDIEELEKQLNDCE